MNKLIVDIETIANLKMLKILPEPEVKTGNLKDESKKQAKIAEAKQKQRKTMGLSPYYGQIICIGLIKTIENSQPIVLEVDDFDEKSILIKLKTAIFQ